MSMIIETRGLKEAQDHLRRFPDRAKEFYPPAVQRSAQILRDETKKLPPVSAKTTGYDAKGIPVASGQMRQSIHTRQIQLLAAGVLPGVNHGLFVHEGTESMKARPFFEWALKFFGVEKKIDTVFDEASSKIASGK